VPVTVDSAKVTESKSLSWTFAPKSTPAIKKLLSGLNKVMLPLPDNPPPLS